MADSKVLWASLATALASLGGSAVFLKPSDDPIFWIGAGGLVAAGLIFLWLLVPPQLTSRRIRREQRELALLEGRANQRQGLDEILGELGQISSQLKSELRWGKRQGFLPNTAWTKNQHLVTGDVRALVETAYEHAHLLDQQTLTAKQPELDERETRDRQHATKAVDAAVEAVRDLRPA